MIKDLINTELYDKTHNGLAIHFIKRYIAEPYKDESFISSNLSVLLIKSGRFKIRLREIVQDLSTHHLLVIPKNALCTFMEIEDKIQLYLITFSSEFAIQNSLRKNLVDSFYFLVRKEPLKLALEDKDYQVLSMIYKLIYFVNKDKKSSGLDQELNRISFNLFLYELKIIYSKYTTETVLHFSRKENLTIQFLTILSIHCIKHHQVKYYAGALFITPAYLNKVIKETTGRTVKEFIIEALVIEAKSMLEEVQNTIEEIAEALHFSSFSAFSSFFKKYTDSTPSQYRQNSIENIKKQ
ncbi:helix-turn-helix domain-containing protein [Flavobacterium agrisoli]|uniref:Helix-turn-helix domain-containing protein n=1 Tax=Flavobacterium agrisoli TaxID=2793066 RepID=A0A934UIA6_9FLAO|nr:helix-turn-helix domain-containing protein [Flavobacterium agrisoli]MBK0368238.1 helix-turn-helix domain-containing protein [Flavobacterium agrisoli]